MNWIKCVDYFNLCLIQWTHLNSGYLNCYLKFDSIVISLTNSIKFVDYFSVCLIQWIYLFSRFFSYLLPGGGLPSSFILFSVRSSSLNVWRKKCSIFTKFWLEYCFKSEKVFQNSWLIFTWNNRAHWTYTLYWLVKVWGIEGNWFWSYCDITIGIGFGSCWCTYVVCITDTELRHLEWVKLNLSSIVQFFHFQDKY